MGKAVKLFCRFFLFLFCFFVACMCVRRMAWATVMVCFWWLEHTHTIQWRHYQIYCFMNSIGENNGSGANAGAAMCLSRHFADGNNFYFFVQKNTIITMAHNHHYRNRCFYSISIWSCVESFSLFSVNDRVMDRGRHTKRPPCH